MAENAASTSTQKSNDPSSAPQKAVILYDEGQCRVHIWCRERHLQGPFRRDHRPGHDDVTVPFIHLLDHAVTRHRHKGELHVEVLRQQVSHLDVEPDEVTFAVEIGKRQTVRQVADTQEFARLDVLQA